MTMRRRAWNRGSLLRTAEANLGSSASDRSICSNSRCSCSESGTALLPGQDVDPDGSTDRNSRVAAYPQVYEGVSGSESRSASAVAFFPGRAAPGRVPRSRATGPLRAAQLAGAQEAGRAYRGGAEPGDRGVGGPFRLGPAVLARAQSRLAGRPTGLDQPFDAYPD